MIVELRQYTLHPGTRDAFVELFDARFVTSQEELAIRVVGQFRDLDDPDRYVWIRSFPDMATRRASLEAFYLAPAPAWRDHGAEANAMMISSDDVLLLEPQPGWSLPDALATATVWPGRLDLGVPALVTAAEANDVAALPVRPEVVTVALGPPPAVAVAPLQTLHLAPTPGSALR